MIRAGYGDGDYCRQKLHTMQTRIFLHNVAVFWILHESPKDAFCCLKYYMCARWIIELCERFVLLLTYNESITMKLMKRDAKIKKLYLLDNFNTMNIEHGCMYLKNVKF